MGTENVDRETIEVLKLAGLAIIIATIANVILYYIGASVDAFDDRVINPSTDAELVVMDVIQASIMFLIIGTIAYFVVNRFTDNTKTNFRNLAGVGYILSLSNPLLIDSIRASTYIFLITMHTVSAVIFIYLMIYKND
ncbi:MAG: hypothetical protein HeimC2_05600 [Candidatus Heimdallarchaeota archaeon LC_2]|nr:MAG: hypothetical protein HeimC2_05600 [Candidatus Heimdallarchaeota archaeon LC_2]